MFCGHRSLGTAGGFLRTEPRQGRAGLRRGPSAHGFVAGQDHGTEQDEAVGVKSRDIGQIVTVSLVHHKAHFLGFL